MVVGEVYDWVDGQVQQGGERLAQPELSSLTITVLSSLLFPAVALSI